MEKTQAEVGLTQNSNKAEAHPSIIPVETIQDLRDNLILATSVTHRAGGNFNIQDYWGSGSWRPRNSDDPGYRGGRTGGR